MLTGLIQIVENNLGYSFLKDFDVKSNFRLKIEDLKARHKNLKKLWYHSKSNKLETKMTISFCSIYNWVKIFTSIQAI